MQDNDRYDLDESNMFQTSFNDSYFIDKRAPDKQEFEGSLAGSIDFNNESECTFIQENV